MVKTSDVDAQAGLSSAVYEFSPHLACRSSIVHSCSLCSHFLSYFTGSKCGISYFSWLYDDCYPETMQYAFSVFLSYPKHEYAFFLSGCIHLDVYFLFKNTCLKVYLLHAGEENRDLTLVYYTW